MFHLAKVDAALAAGFRKKILTSHANCTGVCLVGQPKPHEPCNKGSPNLLLLLLLLLFNTRYVRARGVDSQTKTRCVRTCALF